MNQKPQGCKSSAARELGLACLQGNDAAEVVHLSFAHEANPSGSNKGLIGCAWYEHVWNSHNSSILTASYFGETACIKGRWDFLYVNFEVFENRDGPTPVARFHVDCVVYWIAGEFNEFNGTALLCLQTGNLYFMDNDQNVISEFGCQKEGTKDDLLKQLSSTQQPKHSKTISNTTNKLQNTDSLKREIPTLLNFKIPLESTARENRNSSRYLGSDKQKRLSTKLKSNSLYASEAMLLRDSAAEQGPSLFLKLVSSITPTQCKENTIKRSARPISLRNGSNVRSVSLGSKFKRQQNEKKISGIHPQRHSNVPKSSNMDYWTYLQDSVALENPTGRDWDPKKQRARTVKLYNTVLEWQIRDKLWHSKHLVNAQVTQLYRKIAGVSKWFEMIENDVKRIRTGYAGYHSIGNIRDTASHPSGSETSVGQLEKHPHHIIRYVLRCIAYTFPEVGYCQGMHHLVQHLLLNSSAMFEASNPRCRHIPHRFIAESTLLNLILLFEDPSYRLRDLYSPGFHFLHKLLDELDRRLKVVEPTLHQHLQDISVSPAMYATKWFLTLFSSFVEDRRDSILLQNFFLRFLNQGWTLAVDVAVTSLACIKELIINQEIEQCLPMLTFSDTSIASNPLRLVLGTDVGQEILEQVHARYQRHLSRHPNTTRLHLGLVVQHGSSDMKGGQSRGTTSSRSIRLSPFGEDHVSTKKNCKGGTNCTKGFVSEEAQYLKQKPQLNRSFTSSTLLGNTSELLASGFHRSSVPQENNVKDREQWLDTGFVRNLESGEEERNSTASRASRRRYTWSM